MRTWACLAILVSACSADDPGAAIDAYIEGLPYLPVDPPQVVAGTPSQAMRDGDYSCVQQDLQETRQLDRIIAYAANSDSLYPGAIVSADSVATGLFTQIVLPRAPETISISLENLAGTKKATISDPSLASYREAVAGILDSDVTGSTPANIYSEVEQVHSQQQLDMALGIQAGWALGLESLKTSFDFSNTKMRSRYVVRYTQAYYTVDLDAPQSPSALFAPGVTVDDVAAKMDAQRPPAYVSSVTYGRMIVFTFESQYSAEELGAALDFTYTGGVDVSGDVSVTYKDIISQSKITAYILGGDAGTAVQSIDSYDALVTFIKSGGNYSKDSPGAPIAYKLSYLKDNSPARMSFTTSYTTRECERVSQKVKVTLQQVAVDAGGDRDVYGTITAAGTDQTTLFSKDSGSAVAIKQGQAFGSASSPIAEGVIDVAPQAGKTIDLHANITDKGLLFSHALGNDTLSVPFETGWRKTVTLTLTGSGSQVRVVFALSPI